METVWRYFSKIKYGKLKKCLKKILQSFSSNKHFDNFKSWIILVGGVDYTYLKISGTLQQTLFHILTTEGWKQYRAQYRKDLTFMGPCIVRIFQYIYPTRCNVTQFILSENWSTCFGWYHHTSSGAQTTVSTASGICHTVTATCRYRGSTLKPV